MVAFLRSGYVCPHCGVTLMSRRSVVLVRLLDAQGEAVPLLQARGRVVTYECMECKARWPIFADAESPK
jgi:hypothetical protein